MSIRRDIHLMKNAHIKHKKELQNHSQTHCSGRLKRFCLNLRRRPKEQVLHEQYPEANFVQTASWSNGHAFVSGSASLRFKSRAGQIGHSVANGSLHFFERSCAVWEQ